MLCEQFATTAKTGGHIRISLSSYNVRPMRLLLKFNLILIVVFGFGAAAAG